MVKIFFYLLCFWWIGIERIEAKPFVDASIDAMNRYAHFPLQGTITITHSKEEKVDPQSFVIEGKPLEVSFVKDVKMSAGTETLISIYSFQLPAQDKGLYILPTIEVKIGGKTYTTIPSTYDVQEEASSQAPISPSSKKTSAPVIFRLEASIQGPTILYPGERTKLVYHIFYNRSVDLSRSLLPMIHPAHFQKVGDVQIRDYQLQDVTVQDLTQEVEASELGTFSLGPSLIEGYAYTMKAGQKIYDSTVLKSEAPAITLEVKPLPESQQPASFTGTLGNITVKDRLLSSNRVKVGEIVQLEVEIQGITNLSESRFPLLACQPGFSGFFQIGDLPPLAEVKDHKKIFYIKLRPLTSLIREIPPIEISSFDPTNKKYIIQHTSPIPLIVKAFIKEKPAIASLPLLIQFPSVGHWPSPSLPSLEIEGSVASQRVQMTSSFSWLRESFILWFIPVGCILLLLQKDWHRRWQQRPKKQIPQSEQVFKQALKTENLQELERAFWLRLWEKGWVLERIIRLEQFPQEGKMNDIRSFILQLQALQYSQDKSFDSSKLKKRAKQLFKSI